MPESDFFFQVFVYLAAAVISVPVAKKLGLGSVLGYLIAGVVIGPDVFGFVGSEGHDVMHFAEFGVVLMLFLIGLELQPEMMWRLRGAIVGMGGLQMVLSSAAIFAVALVANLQWQTAFAVGLILALSSTAGALQTLKEKNLMKTDGGQNSFCVLLFQDISVIPILAFLPLLAAGSMSTQAPGSDINQTNTLIDALPSWDQTLVVLGVVAAIIISGRYLITRAFRMIALTGLRELFTAASLLLVVAVALLMTKIGLSPALGTFLAGVVLAQSEYRHELESEIEPFKGLFLGLFFIAVGASVDFNLIMLQPLLVVSLVAGLVLVKFLVLFSVGKLFRMGADNNLLFAFSLSQGGEFAFVLFSFAVRHNVIEPQLANLLIAIVALSLITTPILMLINEKIIQPRFGTKEMLEREPDGIPETSNVIIAGFGKVGSIIGRFLQANGVKATYLDLDADNVDVLRKLGLNVFYGDASRKDLLHAAGAEDADLLIIAVDNPHKTIEIAQTAQRHFSHLDIIARTSTWNDSHQLIDMGIKDVYRETLDSSLRMASAALIKMGHRGFNVYRAANTFRKHDEKYLHELVEMRHDRSALLREAKQRIEDLEQLLIHEKKNIGKDKDLGWDTTSMIEEYGKPKQKQS